MAALQQNSHYDKIHAEGYLSLKSPSDKQAQLELDDILDRCHRIDLTSEYSRPLVNSITFYNPVQISMKI